MQDVTNATHCAPVTGRKEKRRNSQTNNFIDFILAVIACSQIPFYFLAIPFTIH
jgi:hypothetical protein